MDQQPSDPHGDLNRIAAALGGGEPLQPLPVQPGSGSPELSADRKEVIDTVEHRLATDVRAGLEYAFAGGRVDGITYSLESAGEVVNSLREQLPATQRAAAQIQKIIYAGLDGLDPESREQAMAAMGVVDGFASEYYYGLPKINNGYEDAESGARPLHQGLVEARQDTDRALRDLEPMATQFTPNASDNNYAVDRYAEVRRLAGVIDLHGHTCATMQDRMNPGDPSNQLSRMVNPADLVGASDHLKRAIMGYGQDQTLEINSVRAAANTVCEYLDSIDIGLAVVGHEEAQLRDRVRSLADGVRELLDTSPVLSRTETY